MEELTEQQHDDIAAYLSDQMTSAQKTVFEEQLSQNPALQEELELQQRIRRGMQFLSFEKEAAAMFARVKKEVEQESVQEDKQEEEEVEEKPLVIIVVRPLWKRPAFWWAAATVVLLLGLFWKLYTDDIPGGTGTPIAQKDSTKKPPVSTDTTKPDNPTPSPTPPTDPGLLLADAFFSPTPKANPAPVDLPVETDAGTTPDSVIIAQDSVAVVQGIELLRQKQERKAIGMLEKTVVEGYPGHWRACAEWYLSLAYLRDRQSAKALPILTRIVRTDGHPYQQEARQLRNRLKK
ncbi:hypothetical protein [Larkinella rosea]|uniref:Tetratricopeptide repeat protein n=1 Tax=Larkinella rosea TaxID=2025312 RepID=A0A3P1BG67_9BACT|nr:hypothetical protein [Larkinella rosea]RRB00117.1 hypothetical protein EHT25_26195 [Larkinella rosea]